MREILIAVAVLGEKNLTRITAASPYSKAMVQSFAKIVATKDPSRTYYVVTVDKATWGSRRKDPILIWHVGEGVEHAEGWWVEAD